MQKQISKKDIKNNLKNTFKSIDMPSIIKMIFWIIFLIVLLYFTIAFVAEKTGFNNCIISGAIDTKNNPFGGLTIKYIKDGINNGTITATDPGNGQTTINAYIAMYKAAGSYFHLINFSLMSFITNTFAAPATDPTTAWTTRSNAIDLAYSYMFITCLIALVALAMQIYISAKMIVENNNIKKYNLSTKFPTSSINFSLFKTRMYTDFVTNLAIVFAFFNFLSTLIVIGYWILTYSITWIVKKVRKGSGSLDDTLSQHKSDLMYLLFVMIFQNIYTIVKAIFLSKWGVNLDLIFSIILPIGTITVIVGIFIKNMLSSKVNSVLNSIKGIEGTIATFRTFAYTNGIESLDDFNFVSILPPMIKIPLTNGSITKAKAGDLMLQLDNGVKFVETHYANNPKEKQFMLYTLMNNVTSIEQIQEMQNNILKKEAGTKVKTKIN